MANRSRTLSETFCWIVKKALLWKGDMSGFRLWSSVRHPKSTSLKTAISQNTETGQGKHSSGAFEEMALREGMHSDSRVILVYRWYVALASHKNFVGH